MDTILRVTSADLISRVNDLVHDCFFDRDEITFDLESSSLRIPFRKEVWDKRELIRRIWFIRKYRVPSFAYTLMISHAESYSIFERDLGGPGSDDWFNVIRYNSNQKKVTIETTFTDGIEVIVKNLEVSIIESGDIVEQRNKLSIL